MSEQVYTKNNRIFQELLFLLGHVVHSNLMRQIDYLKVENQILRSKAGKRVNVSACEKRKLLKYGLPLNGRIRHFISIVSYSTFRKWATSGIPLIRKMLNEAENELRRKSGNWLSNLRRKIFGDIQKY